MQQIPLPRKAFDNICTTYDLRCYCGHTDKTVFDSDYIPGRFTGVAEGETVKLFAPGKYKDFASYTELIAEVINADPIKINIVKMVHTFNSNGASAQSS